MPSAQFWRIDHEEICWERAKNPSKLETVGWGVGFLLLWFFFPQSSNDAEAAL